MFRASPGPSSGGTTVFLRHFLLVILYSWLSGMQDGTELFTTLVSFARIYIDACSTEHIRLVFGRSKRTQDGAADRLVTLPLQSHVTLAGGCMVSAHRPPTSTHYDSAGGPSRVHAKLIVLSSECRARKPFGKVLQTLCHLLCNCYQHLPDFTATCTTPSHRILHRQ